MKKAVSIKKLTKGLTFEKVTVYPTFTVEIKEAFAEELKELEKVFDKADAGDEFELQISFVKKECKKK